MNFTTYQSSPSGGEIDIPPLTLLHSRSNEYLRGYRMWNHIVVALLQGSIVSGLIAIVERVKMLLDIVLNIFHSIAQTWAK